MSPLVPVRVGVHVETKTSGPDMRCVLRNGRHDPMVGVVVHLIGQSVDIAAVVSADTDDLEWHHNIPLRSINDDATDPPLALHVDPVAQRLLAARRHEDVRDLMNAIVPKPRHALVQEVM